jgi:ribonuclease Z
MSIQYKVLGKPGRDNALMVWVNCGTRIYKILFDCGEDVLKEIPPSDVRSIDYIFFSHLHLDHAAGFDHFIRRNYDRESKPVYIFGPEETSSIVHNRLRGYKWNLVSNIPGEWIVTDLGKKDSNTYRFLAKEGFSKKHFAGKNDFKGVVISNEHFKVESVLLNHIIDTAAFRITEHDSFNIDKEKLVINDYKPGAWLEEVKDLTISPRKNISVNGNKINIGKLREQLLIKNKGDSISYLTDFIYDTASKRKSIKLVQNCDTIICESQYLSSDSQLALKNYHLTVNQSAEIANRGSVGKLILFHNSDRYNVETDYPIFLKEAREIFPNSDFPEQWNIETD